MRSNGFLLIHGFSVLSLVLSALGHSLFLSAWSGVWVSSLNVTFAYLVLLLGCMARVGGNYLHPLCLFIYTAGLFVYGRFVFHCFGLTDLTEPNFLGVQIIDEKVIEGVHDILVLFALVASIFISLIPSRYFSIKTTLRFDPLLYQLGVLFMLVGMLPTLNILVVTLKTFLLVGYTGVFRGELIVETPVLIKSLSLLFRLGFLLVLVSLPDKKRFLLPLIIFTPFLVLNLLVGVRGYYLSFIIMLIFYYYTFILKGKRMSFKRLLLIGGGVVMVGDILASYRLGLPLFSAGLEFVYRFLYDQGTTVLTLIYAVEFEYELSPLLGLSNYFDLILGKTELIQNMVDEKVSPGANQKGFSLGGSIFQESYLIGGLLAIACLGAIVPFLVVFLPYYLPRSRFGVYLLVSILPYIIFSPRARLLDFIAGNMLYAMFFLVVLLFIGILRKPKGHKLGMV